MTCRHTNLTDDDHHEIRRLRAGGVSGADLARRYGVSEATISDIVNGKRLLPSEYLARKETLNDEQVAAMRRLVAAGASRSDLAVLSGVSTWHVTALATGEKRADAPGPIVPKVGRVESQRRATTAHAAGTRRPVVERTMLGREVVDAIIDVLTALERGPRTLADMAITDDATDYKRKGRVIQHLVRRGLVRVIGVDVYTLANWPIADAVDPLRSSDS